MNVLKRLSFLTVELNLHFTEPLLDQSLSTPVLHLAQI